MCNRTQSLFKQKSFLDIINHTYVQMPRKKICTNAIMSKVTKRLQAFGRGTSHQEDDERKDRKNRTNMQVVDKKYWPYFKNAAQLT